MIRVALALAWREVRLTVYRAASVATLMQRRLTPEQRAEIAADAEAMAWAMLDAERNAERGGAP